MCSEPDVMKRDRFELLSAYLDGEVTPEERRLVQTWLNNDPTAKSLYNRLMALRYGLREDVSPAPCEADVTLAGVYRCLNHRFRMVSMAGAGVVILGALNLLSGSVGPGPMGWHMAQGPSETATLKIALDQPAFPIPAVSVSSPVDGGLTSESLGLPLGSDL
jgi:anti-sigma factor RsiW